MGDVLRFPGAGITPAPGPPVVPVDMDGIGDRWTAYSEARETGAWTAGLLAAACAADVPALRDEIHRLEQLLAEAGADCG